MSKKSKIPVPSIYEGLETPNKKVANRALVRSMSGEWFVFPDQSVIAKFPEIQIEREIVSLDKLLEAKIEAIEEIHTIVFGGHIPKNVDQTTASLMIFAYLIKNAKPLIPQVTTNSEGVQVKKERKSTIGSRVYTLGEVREKIEEHVKTPQALACYKILLESLTDPKSEGTLYVTEEILKANVIARASELKTRQDPWRIFQYYRPQLLLAKIIKHD